MWSLLEHHGRIEDALRQLLDEYEVGEDELQTDLLAFVDRLQSHDLVNVHDG